MFLTNSGSYKSGLKHKSTGLFDPVMYKEVQKIWSMFYQERFQSLSVGVADEEESGSCVSQIIVLLTNEMNS